MFQVQAMFEAFEGLLNAPALMIECAELRGGKDLRIEQIGHEDRDSPVGRNLPHQTHPLRGGRAFIVTHITRIGSCQCPLRKGCRALRPASPLPPAKTAQKHSARCWPLAARDWRANQSADSTRRPPPPANHASARLDPTQQPVIE